MLIPQQCIPTKNPPLTKASSPFACAPEGKEPRGRTSSEPRWLLPEAGQAFFLPYMLFLVIWASISTR